MSGFLPQHKFFYATCTKRLFKNQCWNFVLQCFRAGDERSTPFFATTGASFPRRTKIKVWLRINHYRYWQIINLSKLKKCAKTFTINHLERQCWRSGPSLAACPAGDCGAAAPCPAWGWRGGRRWGSGGACCCCCYPGCCWTCCPASCRPCPPGRCCQLSFQPAGPSCAGDKLKIIHGQCSGAVLFWLCSGSSSIFEQFFAVNLFRKFLLFSFLGACFINRMVRFASIPLKVTN